MTPYPVSISNDAVLRELAMAVARNRVGPNDPIEEVLAAHTISPQEFDKIVADPVFKTYVKSFVKELTENGFSFAAKCRVLAEAAIEDLYLMTQDPDAPAAARVKAVENLVDWGGLAPKNNTNGADAGRPTFSISINIPNAAPMTITGTAPSTPLPHPTQKELAYDGDEDDGAYE